MLCLWNNHNTTHGLLNLNMLNRWDYYVMPGDSALRLVYFDHMTSQQFSRRRTNIAFNGYTRLRCAVSRWNSKALVYHVITQLMTGTNLFVLLPSEPVISCILFTTKWCHCGEPKGPRYPTIIQAMGVLMFALAVEVVWLSTIRWMLTSATSSSLEEFPWHQPSLKQLTVDCNINGSIMRVRTFILESPSLEY